MCVTLAIHSFASTGTIHISGTQEEFRRILRSLNPDDEDDSDEEP
jgi:hypothetical protein